MNSVVKMTFFLAVYDCAQVSVGLSILFKKASYLIYFRLHYKTQKLVLPVENVYRGRGNKDKIIGWAV